MSPLAWTISLGWLALAVAVAAVRGRRGVRAGRGGLARRRLTSPTMYLFGLYLLLAGLLVPVSPGETLSPLFGLAAAIPLCYALATLSAIGSERSGLVVSALLALLHGGSVAAAGAVILAVASPEFVPELLR